MQPLELHWVAPLGQVSSVWIYFPVKSCDTITRHSIEDQECHTSLKFNVPAQHVCVCGGGGLTKFYWHICMWKEGILLLTCLPTSRCFESVHSFSCQIQHIKINQFVFFQKFWHHLHKQLILLIWLRCRGIVANWHSVALAVTELFILYPLSGSAGTWLPLQGLKGRNMIFQPSKCLMKADW